jgi:hypothetical protein
VQLVSIIVTGYPLVEVRLGEPRVKGKTMAQWLKILASDPGNSNSPLDIIRVHVDTNLHAIVEIPLSYDLLREHNFLKGSGRIYPVIDGAGETAQPLRGTNGNCLFPLPWNMRPGPHAVQVDFAIWGSSPDRLHARGSATTIVFTNSTPN